mgnify:CR=1 FL=1
MAKQVSWLQWHQLIRWTGIMTYTGRQQPYAVWWKGTLIRFEETREAAVAVLKRLER